MYARIRCVADEGIIKLSALAVVTCIGWASAIGVASCSDGDGSSGDDTDPTCCDCACSISSSGFSCDTTGTIHGKEEIIVCDKACLCRASSLSQ
ncbi:MAG: hypothetical protein HY897_17385 [Deltaproteobacteria bacterium]|nr:hypothetical protein [Deltaproteobacteria bacterium]